MFLAADMMAASIVQPVAKTAQTEARHYVLIIDFDYLACTLCLDSIQNFLDFIRIQQIWNIAGIITIDARYMGTFIQKKAVVQQIQGFILGNQIRFPIYIDNRSVLAPGRYQGAVLLLFNPPGTAVLRYVFPLPPEVLLHMENAGSSQLDQE